MHHRKKSIKVIILLKVNYKFCMHTYKFMRYEYSIIYCLEILSCSERRLFKHESATPCWTKTVESVKQDQAGYCKKSERATGVVIVSPPTGLYAKKIDPCCMLVWLERSSVQQDWASTRVIWQAGTNWAGPVRIQIYYGPE